MRGSAFAKFPGPRLGSGLADLVMRQVAEREFTRYPVCRGGLNDVLGVISTRSLLQQVMRGEAMTLASDLQPPVFVPETLSGMELLDHFRASSAQIAWLPDEDTGIVILSNTRGSRAAKIMPTWLDYQLGLEKTDWFRLNEINVAANAPAVASGD